LTSSPRLTRHQKQNPRFIAVWCEPSTPQEERRAVISARTDAAGQRRYTALFSNLGTPTKLRAAYSGLIPGDELLLDIAVSAAENWRILRDQPARFVSGVRSNSGASTAGRICPGVDGTGIQRDSPLCE